MFADGVSRHVFLINGQQPGPLIEADEGDNLEIFVKNDLPVENTIHWHGEQRAHLSLSWPLILHVQAFCNGVLPRWMECQE